MTTSAEPSTPSGSAAAPQRRRQITSYKSTTSSPATDRAAERRQRRFMQPGAVAGEAAENHLVDVRRRAKGIGHGCHRYFGRPLGGEAVDAGGDGGICQRPKCVGV